MLHRTSAIHPRRLKYIGGICAISIACLLCIMSSRRFTPSSLENDILTMQRRLIIDEMKSFAYKNPSVSLDALTPATGGTPFRSVVVSYWRSGSTFFGEILNAMPANYYNFEPLFNYEPHMGRGGSAPAVDKLRQLLTCNFTHMDEPGNKTHNNRNRRLWQHCRLHPHLCSNRQFMSDFCQLFPLHSMKIVRLRLALTETLLAELDNVHIVLLVRDPRGTLQSRKHLGWCRGHKNCFHPAILCGDLEADYWAAQSLLKKFPNRLKVIRYEDLSLDPHTVTQSMLEFYGLPFDAAVKQYLGWHTRVDSGYDYSTFRDSKRTPFHWIDELSFAEIERIQASCGRAMELWGYRTAERTIFRRRTFNSVGNYTMNSNFNEP